MNKRRFELFSDNELADLIGGLGWAYSEGFGGEHYIELTNEILKELELRGIKIENWMWAR